MAYMAPPASEVSILDQEDEADCISPSGGIFLPDVPGMSLDCIQLHESNLGVWQRCGAISGKHPLRLCKNSDPDEVRRLRIIALQEVHRCEVLDVEPKIDTGVDFNITFSDFEIWSSTAMQWPARPH